MRKKRIITIILIILTIILLADLCTGMSIDTIVDFLTLTKEEAFEFQMRMKNVNPYW